MVVENDFRDRNSVPTFERKRYIITQQFMKFFLPTILMAVAMQMSTVVDGIIVGNILGSDALAAVNLVMPVTLAMNALCVLFGMGGSALYSIALGQRDKERAKQLFTLSFIMMIVFSVIVVAAGLVCSRAFAELLTRKAPNLTEYVFNYLSVVMVGAPLIIIVPGIEYFVRASGRVKLASAALIIANIINIALDIVFLKVCEFGIRGAGLATICGYTVGLAVSITGIVKCKNLRLCAVPKGKIAKILKETASTGLPNALTNVLNFVRMLCINAIVLNFLGSIGATALSVCTSCLSMVTMFIAGSAQTMIPLLATLYGEGDVKGVRFTVRRAVVITVVSSLVLLVGFQIFSPQISGFFGVSEPEQLAMTARALRIYTLSLPILAIIYVAKYVYSIIGFKKFSSVVATLEGFGIVVPLAWILPRICGADNIWFAYPTSELTALIFTIITTWIIGRKHSEVSGFFLLPKETDKKVLDVTMIQNVSQSVELSKQTIEFCRQNELSEQTAIMTGVALEDMTVNIIEQKHGEHKESYIDVRIRMDEEFVYISIRDNGAPYNPLLRENTENNFDNIAMVLAVAESVSYDNILGMNSSIIKIKRSYDASQKLESSCSEMI